MSKKEEYLFKAVLFLLVFVSNDTLLFGTNENGLFAIIQYLIIAFLGCFCLLYVLINKIKIQRYLLGVCCLLLLVSVLSCTFNRDFGIKYIYEIVIVFIAILYVSIVGVSRFEIHFVDIVSFLAFFSLIVWALNIFFPSTLSLFPTFKNVKEVPFKFCVFSNAYVSRDYTFIGYYRNYSIFREPGVYQIFLLLALLMLFFLNPKTRNKYFKIVVITVAVVTTFSTAGYIVLALEYLIFLLFDFKKEAPNHRYVLGFFGLCLIVAFFALNSKIDIFTEIFENKIGNTNHASWVARSSSFITNIRIGLESPLWGAGWDGIKSRFEYYNLVLFDSNVLHNTNTFLKILGVHGFLYFIPFFVSFFWYFRRGCCFFKTMLVFLAAFALLSNEDLTFNILVYIITFYGLNSLSNARLYLVPSQRLRERS